jgi:hypothetical protein
MKTISRTGEIIDEQYQPGEAYEDSAKLRFWPILVCVFVGLFIAAGVSILFTMAVNWLMS